LRVQPAAKALDGLQLQVTGGVRTGAGVKHLAGCGHGALAQRRETPVPVALEVPGALASHDQAPLDQAWSVGRVGASSAGHVPSATPLPLATESTPQSWRQYSTWACVGGSSPSSTTQSAAAPAGPLVRCSSGASEGPVSTFLAVTVAAVGCISALSSVE